LILADPQISHSFQNHDRTVKEEAEADSRALSAGIGPLVSINADCIETEEEKECA
jgi:hypothetical protein